MTTFVAGIVEGVEGLRRRASGLYSFVMPGTGEGLLQGLLPEDCENATLPQTMRPGAPPNPNRTAFGLSEPVRLNLIPMKLVWATLTSEGDTPQPGSR